MSAQRDTNTIPDTETTEEEGPTLAEMYLRLAPFELREKAGQMMPGEDADVYIDNRYEYLARKVVAAKFDALLDEYNLLRNLFRSPSVGALHPTVAGSPRRGLYTLAGTRREPESIRASLASLDAHLRDMEAVVEPAAREDIAATAGRVKLASEVGMALCAFCLLFHIVTGVAIIHPFLAASGLVMSPCYWLMGEITRRRHRRAQR